MPYKTIHILTLVFYLCMNSFGAKKEPSLNRALISICSKMLAASISELSALKTPDTLFLTPLERVLLLKYFKKAIPRADRYRERLLNRGGIKRINAISFDSLTRTLSTPDIELLRIFIEDGGEVFISTNPNKFAVGGFTVSQSATPIIELMSIQDSRFLAHELQHYHRWKKDYSRLLLTGLTHTESSIEALIMGISVNGVVYDESMAMLAETRATLKDLGNIDPTSSSITNPLEMVGTRIYPELAQLVNTSWTRGQLLLSYFSTNARDRKELNNILTRRENELIAQIIQKASETKILLETTIEEEISEAGENPRSQGPDKNTPRILLAYLEILQETPLPDLIIRDPRGGQYERFGRYIYVVLWRAMETKPRNEKFDSAW